MHRRMRMYRDTAIALESKHPGISQSFRLPHTNSDQAVINSARAFVEAATSFKADFISHEMPDSFLEDVTTAADGFETEIASYNNNREQRIRVTAALKDALSRVKKLKKSLTRMPPVASYP